MNQNLHNLRLSIKIILAAVALAIVLPLAVEAAKPVASGKMECSGSFKDIKKKQEAKDKAAEKLAKKAQEKVDKLKNDAASPQVKAAQKAYEQAKAKADSAFQNYDQKNPASVNAYNQAAEAAAKAENALNAAQAAAPAPSASAQAKIDKAQAAADAAFAKTADARTAGYINEANTKLEAARNSLNTAQAQVNAAEKAAREGGYAAGLVSKALEAGKKLEAAKAKAGAAAYAVDVARGDGEWAAIVGYFAGFFGDDDSEITYSDGSKKKLGDLNSTDRKALEAQQITENLKDECREQLEKQGAQKQAEQCAKDKSKAEQSFGNQIVRKPDGSRGPRCDGYGAICDPTLSVPAPIDVTVSGKCSSSGKGSITCSIAKVKCDSVYGVSGCKCKGPPPPSAPPAAINACPNLKGFYESVPPGYRVHNGQCIKEIDVCPNLSGGPYDEVPPGYAISILGGCVPLGQVGVYQRPELRTPGTIQSGGGGVQTIRTGGGGSFQPLQYGQSLFDKQKKFYEDAAKRGPAIDTGGIPQLVPPSVQTR